MKRKIICAALFILMIACCFGAFACAKQPVPLEAPENIDIWGRDITWDKVDGAQGYVVIFNDREYEVENNEYTLPHSADTGEHTVEIMALGNGVTNEDSAMAEFSFTLYDAVSHGYDEKGFEYNLLEDGSGYEISQGRINRETYVHLDLPDKYLGYPVKRIGEYGFTVPQTGGVVVLRDVQTGENCNTLTTTVKFPSRLEVIGEWAFFCAIYLTEAEFPDTLIEIEGAAFSDCVRMNKVQFNEGLIRIGNVAFAECAFEELILPHSLEAIGACAFQSYNVYAHQKNNKNNFGPHKFTSVVIPENVKEIGGEMFKYCTNLREITVLSKHIETIGSNLMEGLNGQETPWYKNQEEGWIYLREDILYGYKGEWTEGGVFKVPETVKYIAGSAFKNSNYTEVILPDGLETLNVEIFSGAKNLARITIPESVTAIKGNAFEQCVSLQEIVIPTGVTEIGGYVFYGCTGLATITIPEGVSTIESFTFSGCQNLSEITLPKSISTINLGAFKNCTNLHTINYAGTKLQWKNIEKKNLWFANGVFTVYCKDGKLNQNGAIVP